MGITVNIAKLDSLKKKLATLGDRQKLLARLAPRMAAASIKLLADEFRNSRGPYGTPWLPVVRRRRRDIRARARRAARGLPPKSDKPLIDTGRLRAAATAAGAAQPTPSGLRIIIPVEYASYHQFGTRRIPRRQILPERNTGGLGPVWGRALDREARAVLAEIAKEG